MDKKNRTILIVVLILVILVALLLAIFLIYESAKKTPGAVCGDGRCDSLETWQNCNEDCCAPENAGSNKTLICCSGLKTIDICEGPFLMPCPGIHFYCKRCGDGICGENETQWNCAEDCNITANVTQGAYGFVTLIQGDCMPPIGPSCNKSFLKTRVKVYAPIKENEMTGNYFIIIKTPIAVIASDKYGYYYFGLPNGAYSIMAEDPLNANKDYCNSFGNGYACFVNVSKNLVKFNIDIDHATH